MPTITGTSPNWGGRLLNTCVLYEDSRGNSGFFVDGPNQTYVMAQYAITPAVEAKVDAAVPQAFNFVFCDSCDSAKDFLQPRHCLQGLRLLGMDHGML